MVLAGSGKMLLWGYSYNAGHLLLAKREMLIVLGCDLSGCWFLHSSAGLSFYIVGAFFCPV